MPHGSARGVSESLLDYVPKVWYRQAEQDPLRFCSEEHEVLVSPELGFVLSLLP